MINTSENINTPQNLDSAIKHHQAGRIQRAQKLYRDIIRVEPQNADALHLLGVAAHQQQQHEDAVQHISRAIQTKGTFAPYHSNLGAAYRAMGRLDEAVVSYRTALRLAPESAGVYYNLGNAYKDLGRYDEAVDAYQTSLRIQPGLAEAYNNLGDALKEQGRLDEAVAAHCRAIEIEPALSEAHFNLGNAYRRQDLLEQAVASYGKSVQITPNYVDAHVNLGFALEEQGLIDEAVASYERALAYDDQSSEAHFNRALAWLRQGDFERGWPEYEWRRQCNHQSRHPDGHPWDGSDLTGRRILIDAEQGIGDQIMFASLIPDVIDRSAGCIVECDARLVSLFARSFPQAAVQAQIAGLQPGFEQETSDVDFQIAMASLPRYLRPRLESFPQRRSYLTPDPRRRDIWRRRLTQTENVLSIGISWRGGKDAEARRKRSTTLNQWQPVFQIPGVHFVNLQYGTTDDELSTLKTLPTLKAKGGGNVTVNNWDEIRPLEDLDAFASTISALDLVISVDNSTVHLAGALGVAVWTILPFASDWRWLQHRHDSPWYPSMRLFRQSRAGDWTELFSRVATQLQEHVASTGLKTTLLKTSKTMRR